MGPQSLIHLVERIGHIHDAQHRLVGRVFMARRRGARRLVANSLHGPEHPVPPLHFDDLPALVVRNLLQSLTGLMAADARPISLLHRPTHFCLAVGVDDGAVLADDADALNALLLANVLNDLLNDVALVDQHRVTRAGHHHFRNLGNMPGHHALQVILAVLEYQQRKRQHRR